MDIGHLRHVRWVKDDDPKSQINKDPNLAQNGKTAAQNRWIAYNRMRGQYASAMEHAAPEAFWVDKMKCSHTDENGRIQNPTLNPCAEGISAVKAIAIAQAEGQKIYTINKANAQTALAKLPIGGEVGSEIRNAVNAGKEVTVHEKSINKHGWKGFGYIVIDPETGAGAYLIEGGRKWMCNFCHHICNRGSYNNFSSVCPIANNHIFCHCCSHRGLHGGCHICYPFWTGIMDKRRKNLNNNPCAQMFFQTLATSMITLPVGVTAKVAKQILSLVHLEGAFWGTTVGAASGAKACFAS